MKLLDLKKVMNIVNVDDRADYLRNLLDEFKLGTLNLPPILIVDGIDGSGKGVYKKFIEEDLVDNGYDVVHVKEPSNFLRKEILESVNKKMNPWITTALFLLDRKHQFITLNEKKFSEKTILLFDRSYISTLVYQSVQGIPSDLLLSLHDFVPKSFLIFLFICDVADARKRILKRHSEDGKEIDEFEKIDFLRKIKSKYEEISTTVENVYLIDTSGDEEDIPRIKNEVKDILDKKFFKSG